MKAFSESEFLDLDGLIRELDGTVVLTKESLQRLVESGDSHFYVARDGSRIVGCACLCLFLQPFLTDATVESVVVSSLYRGLGLGRKIIEFVIVEARRLGVTQLHLTSRPSRVAANALYQAVGFSKKETNCYVLDLK